MDFAQADLDAAERDALERFAARTLGRAAAARIGVPSRDEMFTVAARNHGGTLAGLKAYLQTGKAVAAALAEILRAEGVDPRDVRRYLDFAGGYGRNLRFIRDALPEAALHLAEIDREAVDFARESLGATGHYSTLMAADFDCAERFDAILVVSLFSHLRPPVFDDWVARLIGLLAPGGVLALTTHPVDAPRGRFDWEEIAPGRFYFARVSEAGGRLPAEYYGGSLVGADYVAALADQAGARVSRTLPRRIGGQDVHVIRTPARPG